MLTVRFIAIISILALLTLQRPSDDRAAAQERPRTPPCTHWDDMAGEAIMQLAQNKRDLRQVSDATFRMRRARSNCWAGWIALACEDYRAIIQQAPERKMTWPADPSVCAAALAEQRPPRHNPIATSSGLNSVDSD